MRETLCRLRLALRRCSFSGASSVSLASCARARSDPWQALRVSALSTVQTSRARKRFRSCRRVRLRLSSCSRRSQYCSLSMCTNASCSHFFSLALFPSACPLNALHFELRAASMKVLLFSVFLRTISAFSVFSLFVSQILFCAAAGTQAYTFLPLSAARRPRSATFTLQQKNKSILSVDL